MLFLIYNFWIVSFPAEKKHSVEPTWSIDPALALSMYNSEWGGDEVQRCSDVNES